MKHDHWDNSKCSCGIQDIAKLHEQYTELQCLVEDLLCSMEAQKSLDDGFKGMGHNILVEKADRLNGHIRKLKKIVEWEEAK